VGGAGRPRRGVDDLAAADTRAFVRRWVARTVEAPVVAPPDPGALVAELGRVGIRATAVDRVEALRGGPFGAVVLSGALRAAPSLDAALAAAARVLDDGALLVVEDEAGGELERAIAARYDVLEVHPAPWRWRAELAHLRALGARGLTRAVRLLRDERRAIRAGAPAAGIRIVASLDSAPLRGATLGRNGR
jgi:hypothetical protein